MKANGAVVTTLLGLLLASLPWLEGGASPLGLFVTHAMVLALLGLVVLARIREGRILLAAGWEAAAALGLGAACALSFLRVDYLFGSFLALWDVLIAILLAAAMLLVGDRAWRLCAIVVAASAAAQAIGSFVMSADPNLTPSASFANANQLAAYLNVGAFVALGLATGALREGSHGRAAAFLALAAADICAVILAGARGALVSLLLVSAIWIAASVPRRLRAFRAALWAALLVLALAALAAVVARFERIQDPYRFDRLRIWRAALETAQDHPLLGIGPGMFQRRGYRYNFPLDREMFRFSKTPGSTHSTYLQALAETGLTGLAAVTLLLILIVPAAWRVRAGRPPAGAAAIGPVLALLACLVHGIVETPFEVPAVTLSLIALLVPLLTPRDPGRAPLYLVLPCARIPPRRIAASTLAGALSMAFLGGVLFPYAAHLLFERGLRASRPGSSHRALTSAIRINPYNPLYPATRADLAWRRDEPLTPAKLAEAHLDLAEAHRLDPGNPEFLLRMARLHARACFEIGADAAAIARAESLYRDAIALGLKDPRPQMELAAFLFASGQPEEGRAQLLEALRLEPRYAGARLALARALLDAGKREKAEKALVRLEELTQELASYIPKNGYEEDLMRLDRQAVEEVRARLR